MRVTLYKLSFLVYLTLHAFEQTKNKNDNKHVYNDPCRVHDLPTICSMQKAYIVVKKSTIILDFKN